METITGVAIKTHSGFVSLPSPARHHNLIRKFHLLVDCSMENQGFVTSKRRYVNRREALKIAISSGQISKGKWSDELFSEDLW